MTTSTTLRIPRFHMTRHLCVQARELLGWDQLRLSRECGVDLLKLGLYEVGIITLKPISRQAIAYTFEKQGLLFFPGELPLRGGNVRGCCPDPRKSPDYHLLD